MNKPIQPVGIQWVLRSSILLVLSLLASAADDHTAQHGQHHNLRGLGVDSKEWEYLEPKAPDLNDTESTGEWEPNFKMVGSPVAHDEKNSLSPSFEANDDAENLKAKAGVFTGACSRTAPFSFKVGGKSGRVVISTPSAGSKDAPESFATSISFENASEDGNIRLVKERIQDNFFAFGGASSAETGSADATGDQRCTSDVTGYEEFYNGQWNPRPLAPGTRCCPNSADGGKTIMMQHIGTECATPSSASPPSSSTFVGIPANYEGRTSKSMSTVTVECSDRDTPIDIIALVTDSSRKFVHAKVTHVLGTDGDYAVELVDEGDEGLTKVAQGNLEAENLVSIAQKGSDSGNRRRLEAVEGTPTSIMLKRHIADRHLKEVDEYPKDSPHDYALVHATMVDLDGMDVSRTFIVAMEKRSLNRRKLQADAIKLESFEIDRNGDIAFKFASLHQYKLGNTLKIDARIGVTSECNSNEPEVIAIVDMSAMFLTSSQPMLIVNGGWFRRAKEEHGISCDSWEPVIIDAAITDPDMKYSQLARLGSPIPVNVMNDDKNDRRLGAQDQDELNSRRKLLKAAPSVAELEINEEMTQGRRPERFKSDSDSARSLSGNQHKKILVHGYCDTGSPFPVSHFSNAIEFADPDTSVPTYSSWRVWEFAQKIDRFADQNNIGGCGIIAHSQGGMAALHMYRYYWTCIDYASSGSRSIQSVGTPYRGTNVAGNLASLGSAFNQGCGYNTDLTESGADNWLSNIPYWARSLVNYYTTSFEDNWWSYDYCNLATDFFLDNPEDGAVEKSRGQLSGANNRGHTLGQCHSKGSGWTLTHQCEDYWRNQEMNSQARY